MCKQCEKNPVYEFTNKRKLCKNCFIRYFQKKVLYTIRKFKMAQSGSVIDYENGKGFREVVLEDVLEMFVEKAHCVLAPCHGHDLQRQRPQAYSKGIKIPTRAKVDKIAISSTIDQESNDFIYEIINGNLKKLNKIKPVWGKSIKPLYLFLDKEVLLYAKLKGLKFIKKKQKKDKISNFINELEKKHPEVKRAIVNSYLKLYV